MPRSTLDLFDLNLFPNLFSVSHVNNNMKIFSFIISVYALSMSNLSQSCKKDNFSSVPEVNSSAKTYLALGDSYTIGQNVLVPDRYPHLTVSLLKQQGIQINNPDYIATSGWTTANLLSAINSRALKSDFDLVSLLIGVNDQYQGLDTAVYRMRFTQILSAAIGLAANRPNRVFVLSIPDYSATPFVPNVEKTRVSKEIDEFNFINRQVSEKYHVVYLDITPLSREAANDPGLLTGDQLHYSGKEYQAWAALLAPLMKTVL